MKHLFLALALFCGALFGANSGADSQISESAELNSDTPNSEIAPIKHYALDESFILAPKSLEFIQVLGAELDSKADFSLRVAVVDDTLESAKNLLLNIISFNERKFSYKARKQLEHIEHLINSQKLTLQDIENTDKKTAQKLKAQRAQERVLAYKNALFLYCDFLDPKFSESANAVIMFFSADQKIEIILSESAKGILDSEKIYFDYMAPLLPKKDEKLTPSRTSAIIVNGYSYAADMVANYYNVELENNIKADGSGDNEFTRIAVYLMIVVLGASLLIARFGKKK